MPNERSTDPNSAGKKELHSITIPELLTLPEETIAEVWAKLDAIDAELYKRSDPIVRQAFENGFAEEVPDARGGMCSLGMELWNDRMNGKGPFISATREEKGRRPRWVVLQRSDFPDLYVLKDESLRLRKRAETWSRVR